MKLLSSTLVKIDSDKDVFVQTGLKDMKKVGIEQKGGEIVTGVYDKEQNMWSNIKMPESCVVIHQEISHTIGFSSHKYYVTFKEEPIDFCIAILQQLSEKICAITPVVTPKDFGLEELTTYCFIEE